jgi:hypothetical protein
MDAFYKPIIIVGRIPPALARFGKDAFADIIMDGLLGYLGDLNQISDFQMETPIEKKGMELK